MRLAIDSVEDDLVSCRPAIATRSHGALLGSNIAVELPSDLMKSRSGDSPSRSVLRQNEVWDTLDPLSDSRRGAVHDHGDLTQGHALGLQPEHIQIADASKCSTIADASTRPSATAAPSTTKPASPIDPSRAPTIRGEGHARGHRFESCIAHKFKVILNLRSRRRKPSPNPLGNLGNLGRKAFKESLIRRFNLLG
jgi:hypothetical protein